MPLPSAPSTSSRIPRTEDLQRHSGSRTSRAPRGSDSTNARPAGPEWPANLRGLQSGQQTWEQFLLEAGLVAGINHNNSGEGRRRDSSTAAKRKRRAGSGSSEIGRDMSRNRVERPSGQPTSTSMSSSSSLPLPPGSHPLAPSRQTSRRHSNGNGPAAGSSQDNAIDLSGSPHSVSRQMNSLRHRERSFTDYGPPKWQPDSEVSECPICGVAFSFWYRKHHCRKCGRVVCAACSPHRITIPRQFIVRPPEPHSSLSAIVQPSPSEAEVINLVDDEPRSSASQSTHRSRERSTRQAASSSGLGGGEEVRLCNPCVPDPNPEPPRLYSNIGTASLFSNDGRDSSRRRGWSCNARGDTRTMDPPPLFPENQGLNTWNSFSSRSHRPSASLSSAPGRTQEENRERRRQRERSMALQTGAAGSHRTIQSGMSVNGPPPLYKPSQSSSHNPFQASPPTYSSVEGSTSDPHHHPGLSSYRSISHHRFHPLNRPAHSNTYRNRPLPATPPTARSNGQVEQENACPICNQQFSSNAEDAQEAHIRSCIERHAVRSPSRRSDTHASRSPPENLRMLSFTATEKDCVGADGSPQECTICMEEYEVGIQLARLECLCKFHDTCITAWLGRKEECPVHKVA